MKFSIQGTQMMKMTLLLCMILALPEQQNCLHVSQLEENCNRATPGFITGVVGDVGTCKTNRGVMSRADATGLVLFRETCTLRVTFQRPVLKSRDRVDSTI